MQLTSPPAVIVTRPFSVTVTQHTATADVDAAAKVAEAAAQAGAKVDSFEWDGMSLESNPPQHRHDGTITGPDVAVTDALAAIELLDQSI